MNLLVVLSTFPDAAAASAAAKVLVGEKLAACVNVVPGISSTYMWDEKIETAAEALAIIKTTADAWPALEHRLAELHPYDTPEIVALPAERVLAAYGEWVKNSCAAEHRPR